MEILAQLFPIVVFFAVLALIAFVFRLDRKLSRGSRSAGPREVMQASPAGQHQTPWELKAIDDQIKWGQSSRARQDLVNTVNRLTKAAGVTDPSYILPPGAPDGHIAAVVGHLESELDLPILASLGNRESTESIENLSFGNTVANPAVEQLGPSGT